MIKIAPSILSADFAELGRDIRRIATADYVHFDVMDGRFVPNISIGLPVLKSIRPVTELPIDVHLMIEEPSLYAERFCDAGADLVTMHVEADTEEKLHKAIAAIGTPRIVRAISPSGTKPWICFGTWLGCCIPEKFKNVSIAKCPCSFTILTLCTTKVCFYIFYI